MKSKLALICFFLIIGGVSNSNGQNQEESIEFTLEEICRSNSIKSPITIKDIEKAKDLVKTFKGNEHLCEKKFHNSINELEKVISDENLNDVCSKKTYSSIRDYHERFISVYTPESAKEFLEEKLEKGLEEIPESLRNFFILFVQKINGLCKRNLIKRYNSEVYKKFQIEDEIIDMFDLIKERASRLTNEEFHKSPKYIEDTLISSVELIDEQKLYIVVNNPEHIVNKVKNICDRKFKPIYEELFLPVIRLNNLGYNDDIKAFKENKEIRKDTSLRRWYKIIETCEQFLNVKLIVNDLVDNNSEKEIDIITYVEAKFLKNDLMENKSPRKEIQLPKLTNFEHEPILFGVSLWSTTSDEVLKCVSQFEHQIKKFMNEKTSKFSSLRNKFIGNIERFKQQWKNRDDTVKVGRLSNWYYNHHNDEITNGLLATLMIV